jgi:hypothetical protein
VRQAFHLAAMLVLLPACAGKETPKPTARTERDKDSILANSKIPNAAAVGKAMRVSDSVAAKVRITDTVGQ